MSALILALAFEARDNSDALWVLGDAVLEAKWYDVRMERYQYYLNANDDHTMEYKHSEVASRPTRRWARAIAACIFFKDWQTDMWPTAAKCHDGIYAGHESYMSTDNPQEYTRVMMARLKALPNDSRVTPYAMPLGTVTLEPGEDNRLQSNPMTTFRGQRLIIASLVCDSVLVHDIRMANRIFMIGSGAMPGRLFSEEAVPLDWNFPTMTPANSIFIRLENIGRHTITVRPVLYGIGIDYGNY